MKSYGQAQQFFTKFTREREQVFKDLSTLKDDIQQISTELKIDTAANFKVGVIGICFMIGGFVAYPLTAGASISMIAMGCCSYCSASATTIVNVEESNKRINEKFESCKEKLKNHNKSCMEMKQHLTFMLTEVQHQYENDFQHKDVDAETKVLVVQFKEMIKHSKRIQTFETKEGDFNSSQGTIKRYISI